MRGQVPPDARGAAEFPQAREEVHVGLHEIGRRRQKERGGLAEALQHLEGLGRACGRGSKGNSHLIKFLIIHSIFLGIKFDIQLYKLFRRVVLLLFIIFELIAQGMLVYYLFNIKSKISAITNKNILTIKMILVSILVIVAFASLPILVTKGNTHFKHALEWNYFVGVITFYLLTFFFWRRTT